jgi:hypothetical protein
MLYPQPLLPLQDLYIVQFPLLPHAYSEGGECSVHQNIATSTVQYVAKL